MVIKRMKKQLEIRNEVTAFYIRSEFERGDALLADSVGVLSNYIKLECIGNRHFYKRELADAIRCYEEGISLNSEHQVARYQYLVGVQLEKKMELVEAFKRYQAAIEADSSFVDAYVELGGLLVRVGDLKGALHCYRDAVRIDSSDPGNLFNLKAVLERLVEEDPGDYEDELKRINKTYEGCPRGAQLQDKSW
ncbi:hypothetical protein PHLH3_26260 [Pseudomonas sp. St386]|jgi:hypothetical protein|nr:hypothetical protein PflQ8_2447 [Pseudomonas fluorescens Q8r1-96]BBP53000.1 hypothetical protein PHLH3_26260 [Pseudomonas sp. St386]SDP34736.1 Tetratricopeptide repeat-containing protein [Pseudomonas brassicacearum]